MNQLLFNSVKWLESQSAVLGGFIVHADEYVNCIQIIGNQEPSETGVLSNDGLDLTYFMISLPLVWQFPIPYSDCNVW